MRVAEHDRHAGGGGVLADRVHVAAERGVPEELQRAGVAAQRLGDCGRVRLRPRLRAPGRRLRVGDVADEHRRRGEDAEAEVAPDHVVERDLAQPGAVAAGQVAARVLPVLDLAHVAAEAVGEALGAGLRAFEHARFQGRDGFVGRDRLPEEVAVDVARGRTVGVDRVRAVGAEIPRALAVDRDDVVHQHAEVVFGLGVAIAIPERAEIAFLVRADVGDAEVGAGHRHVVAGLARPSLAGRVREAVTTRRQRRGDRGKHDSALHGVSSQRLVMA